MRLKFAAALAAVLTVATSNTSSARRDHLVEAQSTAAEVIVFEIDGCRHCTAFRETLAQRYLASTTNAKAPMRFVDVGRQDPAEFALARGITTVPTIVLMRDGREIDRVEGHPPPDLLFGMVKSRLAPAEE